MSNILFIEKKLRTDKLGMLYLSSIMKNAGHKVDMILDVGSGPNPLKNKNVVHLDINKLSDHVDIIADAENLPFRDDTFTIVYASHLLEHLFNPFQALTEFKRVAKKNVIVKIPSGDYEDHVHGMSPEHLYGWTETTFKQLLEKVFPNTKILGVLRYKKKFRGFKHKLETIKFYVSSLFWKNNELMAICEVEK